MDGLLNTQNSYGDGVLSFHGIELVLEANFGWAIAIFQDGHSYGIFL